MIYYSITASVLIGIASLLLVYTLKKLQLHSYRIVLTAGIGSAAVSLLFPVIYRLVSTSYGSAASNGSILSQLTLSAAISIVMIFLISVMASFILPDSVFALRFKARPAECEEANAGEQGNMIGQTTSEGNYLKEIFETAMIEKHKESADFGENTTELEKNLEKSVDSKENTDKIGIETIPIQLQTDDLTIDDCINEAFRLKQTGDMEGAVIYFMYALDRKPDKELVFWIVLDICILYRELKQVELAKDILSAYKDNFGDIMSDEVRIEIEDNLQYI